MTTGRDKAWKGTRTSSSICRAARTESSVLALLATLATAPNCVDADLNGGGIDASDTGQVEDECSPLKLRGEFLPPLQLCERAIFEDRAVGEEEGGEKLQNLHRRSVW